VPTGLHLWSRTAASNATADSSVNWAEGQSPSSVNDSARAMMARIAEWRDDISGALTTGGSSTAFTVPSNRGFASLADLAGSMVAFGPHMTSGDNPTLNVDGLGAKPIRMAPGAALVAGVLVQGTPYVATYYTANGGEFILHGFYGNPYNVPIGGSIEYWGATAPNSSFVFMFGQAISRTTYATLFALFGTTYGTGDGSTTYNIPDLRGRVVAGKDDMGGTSANRLTNQSGGLNGDVLGATGGSETHTLTEAQLASHTHTGTTTSDGAHNHTYQKAVGPTTGAFGGNALPNTQTDNTSTDGGHTHTFTTSATGSGQAHNNVQPTIVANKILRII
jgi:microcystin-dependent protein